MNSNKKIKGPLWNTIGSVMYALNNFAMLTLVNRFATVEQAGYFGIAFTTAQILSIVGLFGANNLQMTDYQHEYSFADYAKVRVFSCILMILGCVAAIFGMGMQPEKTAYLIALTLFMLLTVVAELYQCLFFQNNRLDLSGSALFYRTFWSLLIFTIIIFITKNILLSVLIQTVCNLGLTLYYAMKVAPEFVRLEKAKHNQQSKAVQLIIECIPVFIGMFLMNIITSASKYGIEFFSDDTAQGYYNMIFMPAQIINMCSQFLFKPLLNQYASLLHENRLFEFKKLLKKQILLVSAFTAVCCLMAYWLGTSALSLLYHKDLSMLKIELTLVILGGGVFAICQLFYYILVILRQQKKILAIYVGVFLVTVLITVLSVVYLNLLGAVLSFIVSHVILLVVYYLVLALILRGKRRA